MPRLRIYSKDKNEIAGQSSDPLIDLALFLGSFHYLPVLDLGINIVDSDYCPVSFSLGLYAFYADVIGNTV